MMLNKQNLASRQTKLGNKSFHKNLNVYILICNLFPSQQPAEGVDLQLSNAIFTASDYPLNQSFQQVAQSFYGVELLPVNFTDTAKAVEIIQAYVNTATKGRVTNFIHPGKNTTENNTTIHNHHFADDVANAQIFMISTLFFKGEWKLPFNRSATHIEDFYDEAKNKIGQVMMMYQKAPFPYARVDYLNAHAVELNYGKQSRLSMIVILPRKGHALAEVLSLIASVNVSTLIDILAQAEEQYMDEDVEVYLPRFKITSDFNMNIVLSQV